MEGQISEKGMIMFSSGVLVVPAFFSTLLLIYLAVDALERGFLGNASARCGLCRCMYVEYC